MKLTKSFSTVLWVVSVVSLLMLLPADVAAAWGWGSSSSSTKEVAEVEINNNDDPAAAAAAAVVASSPTVVNSRTLESIIHNEQRFVLYNSRRLTGECLPICAEDTISTPTDSPTMTTFDPFSEGQEGTLPPTTGGSTAGTGFPTAFPEVDVDPGTFCRMENSVAWNSDSECSGTPGSCQMRNPYNGQNSCGPGVPVGFYPDLTRCDAYCKCTGTEAPSEYMILNDDLEWDTHQQGTNFYLDGVWGKGGAWGTNGGGQGRNYEMSALGRDRPPQCGGGNPCTSEKTQSCDGCTKWHTCNNILAGPVMDCAPGTLWNKSWGGCDHAYNVKNCEDTPCPK